MTNCESRSQVSLELILLIAALLAFLLALLPVINEVRELTEFSAVLKQEEIFLNRIAADAKEVSVLGEGNVVEREMFLPADETIVSFDEGKQAILLGFRQGNRFKALSEETGFRIQLKRFNASRGSYLIKASNEGEGKIVVSLQRVHETK